MHQTVVCWFLCLVMFTACTKVREKVNDNDGTETSLVKSETLKSLNITFKNEPYYWPISQNPFGISYDWTATDVFLSKVRLITLAPTNAVTLEVDTNIRVPWMEEYDGYKMYLHNNTLDTIYFTAQDARMHIFLQALDTSGDWHNIEHMKPSWCGVSYQAFGMPPTSNFDFIVPKFEGTYKTKLRAFGVYSIKEHANGKEDFRYIYSNEWEGSINPEQFCRLPDRDEVSALLPWRKYQK